MARKKLLVILVGILWGLFGSPLILAQKKAPVELLMTLDTKEAGGVNQPLSLFLSEHKQQLIISDTGNSRLLFFDARGDKFKLLEEFNADGEMFHPISAVQDSHGKLYVTERGKNEVIIYDRGTNSKDVLAVEGIPIYLAMDINDNLHVLERGHKKIMVFNPRLQLISQVSVSDKAFTNFSDVAIDKKGRIYALETLAGKVYVFDREGNLINKFGKRGKERGDFQFPTSIALDPHGNIYVVDQHRHKVLVFDSQGTLQWEFGKLGWKKGTLYFPAHIFIDSSNRIFIIEKHINRIQIFAPLYRKAEGL